MTMTLIKVPVPTEIYAAVMERAKELEIPAEAFLSAWLSGVFNTRDKRPAAEPVAIAE